MADIRYENGEIVQTYARGGPIASPYASSLTPMQGVGGLFQDQNQFGRDLADLRGSPLQNYQEYLMGTYGKMAADTVQQAAQQDVEHFVKLVDEAERAHFGAEESFGFGGGQMHLDSLSAFDKGPESLSMGNAMTRAIGEDGGGGGSGISADLSSAMITQASFEDGGGGGIPLAMPTADRPKGMTRAIGEDGVGPNPLLSGGMAMTQAMGEDGGGGNLIQGGIEPMFAQLFSGGGEVKPSP